MVTFWVIIGLKFKASRLFIMDSYVFVAFDVAVDH